MTPRQEAATRGGPGSDGEWRAALARLSANPRLVRPVFQPIVDLSRGSVAGYEMLARFDLPGGGQPARWFGAAARLGQVAELDALMLRAAATQLERLPPNTFLAVNMTPLGAASDPVAEAVAGGGRLDALVVELTEQTEHDDPDAVAGGIELLRRHGAMIAVDDVGSGYGSLQRVTRIRPEFVKVDRSFVDGVDESPAKSAAVEMIGVLANRIDAWVVAEGIEREAELEALGRIGVPLAQGYLLARPTHRLERSIDPRLVGRLEGMERANGSPIARIAKWVKPSRETNAGDEALGRFRADRALRFLPVVDHRGRPQSLYERPPAERASPIRLGPMLVFPGAGVADVLARAMARSERERFSPLVYCDEQGTYIGLLPIERLVDSITHERALTGEEPPLESWRESA